MTTSLEEMFGLNPNSYEAKLADALVEADMALMDDLVEMRVRRGLTQRDVGDIMGVSQPTVAEFEADGSNPCLSTIRRYALAVQAQVRHSVQPQEDVDAVPARSDSGFGNPPQGAGASSASHSRG